MPNQVGTGLESGAWFRSLAGIRMKILVTAFGPFGGRAQNASSLALAGLKQRLPRLNTRILPVDSVIAPERMTRALRELEPDVVLMLGEAGGSAHIRLETTAWNELDFRIPDLAGRSPRGERIVRDAPDSMESTLPFAELHDVLSASGHRVAMSDDPGRYLCNQILFHALWSIGRRNLRIKAGFVHLPWENDYPTERVVHALEVAVSFMVRTGNIAAPSAGWRAARNGESGRRRSRYRFRGPR